MNPSFVLSLRLCGRVRPDLASDACPCCLPAPPRGARSDLTSSLLWALELVASVSCSLAGVVFCFWPWPPGRLPVLELACGPPLCCPGGSLEGGCRGPDPGIGVVLCRLHAPLSSGGQPLLGVELQVPLGCLWGASGVRLAQPRSFSFFVSGVALWGFPPLYCQTLFSCLLSGFVISFVISKMCFVLVSFVTAFTCSCVVARGCVVSSPVPGDANAAFL